MAETKLVETKPALPLYERDFHEWTEHMTTVLRKRDAGSLDWENLAEEIESLGGSDHRELRSRLTVLVAHLLKWQYQPQLRDQSTWRSTIQEQRRAVAILLEESPSLRPRLLELWATVYRGAAEDASDQMKTDKAFPKTCPYNPGQVLAHGFYPDGAT